MIRIGLTGGIGSGKSTVARIFNVLGIPVYSSDDASKRLMNEDEELKENIIRSFGEQSYTEGRLNRKYLAWQVFSDRNKIELLNSLVHPATIKDATAWMEKQTAPYIIKEAALIFESGSDKYLDAVIGVKSPLSLRIERTMKRNNVTAAEVEARIKLQMDEEEKLSLCDYIIVNDEHQMLIPQVLLLHERLLKKALQ
ncbi:MAG TPA: dephospho-CoA kinase [Hanamia sp.]|jgi:dephospho-CoA kinase|nr:dephospho-CoA kinase [Hanamia sp.]